MEGDLENLSIVLVKPYISGNVGQAARILANFGIKDLVMVKPGRLDMKEVYWFSAGASGILDRMRTVRDVEEAVADRHAVIGTTARERRYDFPKKGPREMAEDLVRRIRGGRRVAILFGTENSGLSNREIALCDYLVSIPTGNFSSLNLSHAVGIICYEVFLRFEEERRRGEVGEKPGGESSIPATKGEMSLLIAELLEVLKVTGFMRRRTALQAKITLNQILSEIRLSSMMSGILLGMVRKIRYCLLHPEKVKENLLSPSKFDMTL